MCKYYCKPIVLVTLLLNAFGWAHAGSVHKWIDESGVTHYSDQAPAPDSAEVKELIVSDVYSSPSYEEDYYSVTNQWARMREERLERKKLQIEKAKLKAEQQATQPQVVYIDEEDDRQGSVYYPAYGFGHHGFINRHYRRSNHYLGRNINSRFSNRFSGSRGQTCRLPRRGSSKFRKSGLTFSIR